MRKCLSIAGILLFAALLFVQPSKADSFDTFTLTASFVTITFTVPSTVTPATVNQAGMITLTNVMGANGYLFNVIEIGPTGYMGATNYAATGSMTRSLELVAPGLFTWNSDGTVTFNTGTFDMGRYTLTVVDPPGPGDTVTTPEPASLLLLGFGGLALGALRRRKVS
jgi:hypothetical protein